MDTANGTLCSSSACRHGFPEEGNTILGKQEESPWDLDRGASSPLLTVVTYSCVVGVPCPCILLHP